jgi:hypothetical protein
MSKMLCACLLFVSSATVALGGEPAGKWKMTAEGPDGNTYHFDLIIKGEGGQWTGSVSSDEAGTIDLQEVAFRDNQLTFKLAYAEVGVIAFNLRLDGDALKGTFITPDAETGAVSGTR